MSARFGHIAITAVLLLWAALPAAAQSFSVTPSRLEVPAPGQRAQIVLRASGAKPSLLQIRIFDWAEGTDPEDVRPTRAVLASPPMARLRPRQELTVRLMRVSRSQGSMPGSSRHCFRVLVDRLPATRAEAQAMQAADRRSVPLCFD